MADYTGDGKLDLIYIKTKDTASNMVEVHIASAASFYRSRVQETSTTFELEYNGVWTMADTTGDGKLDLIYIKTSNTPSGHVEVHVASGASNYQTRILEVPTTFLSEIDGTWSIVPWSKEKGGDGQTIINNALVFIKTANTPTGKFDVHVTSRDYQYRILETLTVFEVETDGTWLMANYTGKASPDLVFIKTFNTATGKVEVHITAAA